MHSFTRTVCGMNFKLLQKINQAKNRVQTTLKTAAGLPTAQSAKVAAKIGIYTQEPLDDVAHMMYYNVSHRLAVTITKGKNHQKITKTFEKMKKKWKSNF